MFILDFDILSISSTFYALLFRTKVFLKLFSSYNSALTFFGTKATCKMLTKLTIFGKIFASHLARISSRLAIDIS